ncbi:alpha-amylase family glycosyl hydrolase [Enterococcus faecium]|nr:alpha-amylase family glycosyl hydrolase [Enterococcus faecium]
MIIYQCYPKQWGKLKNIILEVPYFKEMAYDAIWLSPCYPSSGYDGGYDVKKYCDIDPDFGTLEEIKELIDECHKNGIKVLMDLVINHCSVEHPTYQMALRGFEHAQAMFHMYDEPQNDWEAIFGGSAWKYEPKINKYVFHAFTEGQIDWNFDNENTWAFWHDVIQFWLDDMNIDGFRVDALTHIAKGDWNLPNVPQDAGANYRCQPKLEGYLKKLADIIYTIKPDAFVMGEANGIDAHGAKQWIDKGYMDTVIQFEHLLPYKTKNGKIKGTTTELIEKLEEWSDVLGEDNLSYVQNHDIACAPSILSLDAFSIADMLFSQNGHVLIYNGQETGQTNKLWHSLDEFTEPETKNRYELLISEGVKPIMAFGLAAYLSRENARQPIDWINDLELTEHYKELIKQKKGIGV